jgi:hypothetical protein
MPPGDPGQRASHGDEGQRDGGDAEAYPDERQDAHPERQRECAHEIGVSREPCDFSRRPQWARGPAHREQQCEAKDPRQQQTGEQRHGAHLSES